MFRSAIAALHGWEHFQLGWVEARSPDTLIKTGEVVAVMGRVIGLWWLNACRISVGIKGKNLVLYTTAEPCPMCQAAVLWSGIQTVVYGPSIRSLQRLGWRQIDILAEEVVRRSPAWQCTLIGGVPERECDALFERAMLHRDQPK